MSYNKKSINFSISHVLLASAFPHIQPLETVDHINNTPNDFRIQNLCWMTRTENCQKGQEKSVQNSKQNGGKNGRHILMKKNNLIIGCFRSIEKAAKYIIINWDSFKKKTSDKIPLQKTVASKITRILQNPTHTSYGMSFSEHEGYSSENEEWKFIPHKFYLNMKEQSYSISTFGRVKGPHGIISFQNKNRNGSKYKSITLGTVNKNKKYYIHRVLWETFYGIIPDGYDICHDDNAPLNKDGSYRNYLEDLHLGTRSENMKEYHNKDTQNQNYAEDISGNFTENIPEGVQARCEESKDSDDDIDKLMKNVPKGIQYCKKTEKRGSKYVISRRFTQNGKDISSSGSKIISDKEKFIEIMDKYNKYVIKKDSDN